MKSLILILLVPTILLTMQPAHDPLQSLSLDEKIGQLFMVRVNCAVDQKNTCACNNSGKVWLDIQNYAIGGIIFLGQTTKEKQTELTKNLQFRSKIPLLVGQDCEWGLGMRMKDVPCLPRQLTLGALNESNDQYIYDMGTRIANDCREIGIHMSFSPVADGNSTPTNSVIGDRSFGKNPHDVARKCHAYMMGLKDAGIIPCAKHFPGHGDTDIDSHDDLPYIKKTKEELEACELIPFKHLIEKRIPAVMVGHLAMPALDPTNKPASQSKAIMHDLLRTELSFNELIVTDALDMKAVTKNQEPGDVELQALKAGADILLCPTNIGSAFRKIKDAITKKEISEESLNEKVRRILNAKKWSICKNNELNRTQINTFASNKLKYEIFCHALTLLKNEQHLLPLSKQYVPIIHIGGSNNNTLEKLAQEYGNSPSHHLRLTKTEKEATLSINAIDSDPIIIALYEVRRCGKPQSFISDEIKSCIHTITKNRTQSIVIIFGSPYAAMELRHASTLLIAYENERESQKAVADALYGKIPIQGKLSVDAGDQFPCGSGITLSKYIDLSKSPRDPDQTESVIEIHPKKIREESSIIHNDEVYGILDKK